MCITRKCLQQTRPQALSRSLSFSRSLSACVIVFISLTQLAKGGEVFRHCWLKDGRRGDFSFSQIVKLAFRLTPTPLMMYKRIKLSRS